MNFLKRWCVYICIILLCISIYKDITEGTLPSQQKELQHKTVSHTVDASIIKAKVQPGDTVLSITERINTPLNNHMNVEQIITDFKKYNPSADPNHLKINQYYYFLHYKDT